MAGRHRASAGARSALHEGGWFDAAHKAAVRDAVGAGDPDERLVAVRTLFAEETRLTMLVGVAVGFELARELTSRHPAQAPLEGLNATDLED